MDFTNLEYLKSGSKIQVSIYNLLNKHKVFDILKSYSPILVGTFPIEINIETSDLDIILECNNLMELEDKLKKEFSAYTNFSTKVLDENKNSLVCNFEMEGFLIEIFTENNPTTKQFGYLHMIKEFDILQSNPIEFKNKIIELKRNGFKTEPAFAKALNLNGDPYLELLKYKRAE